MPLSPIRLSRRLVVAGAAIAALLAGCATLPPPKPEEAVAARAHARWQAMLAGDFEKAYNYINPTGRALTPYTVYRGGIRGFTTWKAAEVVSVTCETSEKCIAVIKVTHEPALLRSQLGTIDSALDETWLLDGGEWWFFYQP